MIGSLMIASGIAALFGLSLLPSSDNNWREKYEINIENINATVNNILPSDIVLFYINDDRDLQDAIKRVRGHLYPDEIESLKNGYNNFNLNGFTFIGSNAAFILVKNIIKRERLKNINDVSREIYITIFHEMYHILLDSLNEKLVDDKAIELVEKNKSRLLPAVKRI